MTVGGRLNSEKPWRWYFKIIVSTRNITEYITSGNLSVFDNFTLIPKNDGVGGYFVRSGRTPRYGGGTSYVLDHSKRVTQKMEEK